MVNVHPPIPHHYTAAAPPLRAARSKTRSTHVLWRPLAGRVVQAVVKVVPASILVLLVVTLANVALAGLLAALFGVI